MRCAIYVRVSTDKEEQKSSIGNQQDLFKDYVVKRGWDIYEFYVDVETGTTDNRAAYKRLISDAESRKFDCILAKELSRLARNGELSYIIKRLLDQFNIHLITLDGAIDTTTGDTSRFGLFAWLYEQESARTSIRIKSTFKTKAERGEFTGSNPPYGYLVDNKKLIVRGDSSVDAIKLIFQLYLQGKGHEAIAKELDNRGYPTPATLAEKLNRGLYWQGSSVKLILKNPHYVGDLVQGRSRVHSVTTKIRDEIPMEEWIIKKDAHESIITRDNFEAVQRLMESRRVVRPKCKKHLFTNLIFCSKCGTSLWYMGNRNGYICGRYRKHSIKACKSHSIKEEYLKKLILDEFREMAAASINKEQILKNMEATMLKNEHGNKQKIKNFEYEMDKLKSENVKLVKYLMDNKITDEDFQETSNSNRIRIKQIQQLADEQNATREQFHKQKDLINKLSVELERILSFNDLDEEILHRLIDKIEVKEKQEVIIHYRFTNPFIA